MQDRNGTPVNPATIQSYKEKHVKNLTVGELNNVINRGEIDQQSAYRNFVNRIASRLNPVITNMTPQGAPKKIRDFFRI